MKRHILTAFTLLCGATLWATEQYTTLTVTPADGGDAVTVAIADSPRFEAADGGAVKLTAGATEYTFEPTVTVTFGPAAGVEVLKAETGATLRLEADAVHAAGLAAGAVLILSDLQGRTVATVAADASGAATLNLIALPTGVYVAATPAGALKIKR